MSGEESNHFQEAKMFPPGDENEFGTPKSPVSYDSAQSALRKMSTTSKVTRSEVEKWMNKENKYLEKEGQGGGEGLGIGQTDPDVSTSLSTLQVTVNTTLMGEADLDETDFLTMDEEEQISTSTKGSDMASVTAGSGTNGGSKEILDMASDQIRQLDLDLDLSATESTLPQQQPPSSTEAVEVNVAAGPPQPQEPVEKKPTKPSSAVAAEVKPKQPKSAKKPPMTNEERERAWKSANSPPKTAGKQTNGGTGTPKSPSAAPTKRVPVTAASARKPVASPTTAPPPTASARTPTRRASAPVTPTTPGSDEPKKIPMNKIKVGAAPSPNVKDVKSKIGSLASASHKPPTSQVKIEHNKLAWKAESRIGSLSNVKFTPSASKVKIETKKVEVKGVGSKIGSLQNVKYKPGGGEKKIFDDKYVKKTSNPSSNTPSEHGGSGSIPPPSPTPASTNNAAAPTPPPAVNISVSSENSNGVAVTSVPVGSLVNFGDA